MRSRTETPPERPITFSVGAPPPIPRRTRPRQPISIWPTAMLGSLLAAALAVTALAGHRSTPPAPASSATTISQPTAP